jgi:leader peptidase (prepilin peptidase)/N-methyltransferase
VRELATAWWLGGAASVGLVLGAAASTLTRRLLRERRPVAGSWWLGAAVTAVVLALLAWQIGDRGACLVFAFAGVLAVPLTVIDWCEHRLPRLLSWPLLAGVILGFAVLCLARHDLEPGVRAGASLLAAGGLFLVLAVASIGGVGAGDISVAAVVGAVAGWIGWPQVAGELLVASLLALLLVVIPGGHRRDESGAIAVPFGPCLLGGALVVVLIGG